METNSSQFRNPHIVQPLNSHFICHCDVCEAKRAITDDRPAIREALKESRRSHTVRVKSKLP